MAGDVCKDSATRSRVLRVRSRRDNGWVLVSVARRDWSVVSRRVGRKGVALTVQRGGRLRAEPGEASGRMSRQASRDTQPELRLRSELHRRGLRYVVHRRPLFDFRREADILFPRLRIAVFVNGCFWHGCELHRTNPMRNAEFWTQKIEGNIRRDLETDLHLADFGWTVVRIWEHERTEEAADRVEQVVREARARLG